MKRIPRPEFSPEVSGECVIVGNGPSLTPALLDSLSVDTIAMNRIHLIYDKTDWRPTYWFNADLSSNYYFKQDLEFHASQGYPCFVRMDILARWIAGYMGVITPEDMVAMLENMWPIDAGSYEWTDEIVAPGSTMASAIRAAALWGYNPIYLIGCDGGPDHFDPNYDEHDTGGRSAEEFDEMLNKAFQISFAECWKRDIKIYNATPNSKIKGIPCAPLL